MDQQDFDKVINDLVKEYDDHYFQEMEEKARLQPYKLNEIKDIFTKIADKVPMDSRLPDFIRNAIYDNYMKKAIETLKQSNDKINNFIQSVNDICPCKSCPKYVYNKNDRTFNLNKLPEKGCVFTYCAIDDTIDLLNDWNTVLKTKKIKRGANKNVDLSIFDLNNIIAKIKSNTDRAINVLTENLNQCSTKNIPETKSSMRLLSASVIIIAIIAIMLFIIIIIYCVNIINPTYTREKYPVWLLKLMIRQ